MITRLALGAAVAVLTLTMTTTPVVAQREQNAERALQQLKELRNKARDLLAAGRLDQAERVLAEAKRLAARLANARKEQARRKQGSDDYYGVFQHLEGVIVALRKLGRNEEAEKVLQFAKQLRRELRERRGRDEEKEEREEKEEHEEREEREEKEEHEEREEHEKKGEHEEKEEHEDEVEELEEDVEELEEQVEHLTQRVKKLERVLAELLQKLHRNRKLDR